jgi:hypothetical protein
VTRALALAALLSSGCAHYVATWQRARHDGSLACSAVLTRADPRISNTGALCVYDVRALECSCSVPIAWHPREGFSDAASALVFPAGRWLALPAGLTWPESVRLTEARRGLEQVVHDLDAEGR